MSESKTLELSPSVSIIIAGIIIAGAIIYTRTLPPVQEVVQQEPATQLGPTFYAQVAQQLGADDGKFASCFTNKTYQNKIDKDTSEATNTGGQGTPYTLVYDTKTKKASVVSGALPYEQFMTAIEQASASAKTMDVRPPSAQDHIVGSPAAPIVLIEYSDFQCPFCSRVHPTLQRIVSESNGKISWVYRHFPLSSIHPQATPAANASECIAEQLGSDGFWKFAGIVFKG